MILEWCQWKLKLTDSYYMTVCIQFLYNVLTLSVHDKQGIFVVSPLITKVGHSVKKTTKNIVLNSRIDT